MANTGRRPEKEAEHRINNRITAPMVRVVGDNVTPAVMPIRDAMRLADEMELDLIEIAPTRGTSRVQDCRTIRIPLPCRKRKAKEMKAKR